MKISHVRNSFPFSASDVDDDVNDVNDADDDDDVNDAANGLYLL